MTFPTREDEDNATPVREYPLSARPKWMTDDASEWAPETEKPRLDWLLLAVLTADLGVWVGLLAWWIWR